MRSSTPLPTPSSPQQQIPSSSSASSSFIKVAAANDHTNAATPSASPLASSSSSLPSTSVVPPPSASSSSTPHATQTHAATTMSDAVTESRDDDPSSSAIATPVPIPTASGQIDSSTPPSTSAPLLASTTPLNDFTSLPRTDPSADAATSALPSGSTSSGAQTPQPTCTISTLKLASDALSTIPQSHPDAANVPTAAAELLSAIHRKNKKAPAIQSPNPASSASARSRSAATTPVPTALLLGVKHDSFDVTANSSRATTPTRTPSGRAKRQRRERNAATPSASALALPSIEQNDRRRSARVAKVVTTTASDSPSLPNLAPFGFSPYLENLVLNAKDTDRRTRSGGRGFRPPVDRAPARVKRTAPKNKTKEVDPDGPDDEAKSELYRQLCLISYLLQAHLDLVPHKSLEQLRAQLSTPSPDEDDDADAKLASAATADANAAPDAFSGPSRAVTPAINGEKLEQHPAPSASTSTHTQPINVKIEPPASPAFLARQPDPPRPPYSPESSPEVALMDTIRPTYNGVPSYYPNASQSSYQPQHEFEQQSYSWAAKVDEPEDEPMSPVYRPARSNIMSISALMSGPSPSKARSPTPELIQTPPRPVETPPMLTQEWTEEDEMASRFLQACADAIPKIDTTELDRLTQIAQLAAFDLEMLSASSSPRASTPSLSCTTDQQRSEASAKFHPQRLNPLDTLDTQELYNQEEAEYLDEMQANNDLYETVRYLASFDEVVDEWRAGELARLRLQLELRKAEIERIWTCDRKLAWSTFVDNRAGELYRKEMARKSHAKWQAEMELDLLEVHRRKTRGVTKLIQDIWLPKGDDMESAEAADIYKRYGQFVSAAKYPKVDDPLVRADVRKMRRALRAHEKLSREQQKKEAGKQIDDRDDEDAGRGTGGRAEAAVDVQVDAISSSESDSQDDDSDEYDSDTSYASSFSGISSLPSFSSVYSSPVLRSIADVDVGASDLDGLASEVASLRDADAGSESDEDADESLWARQIRLANQQAEQGLAPSTTASGVQTPAANMADGELSAMPSRAATPAPARKRERKRKKRPPPPGARLWKKGRVQQDNEAADGDEVEATQPTSKLEHAPYQNGDTHTQRDTEMAEIDAQPSIARSPKMQRGMADYDYRSADGQHHFTSQQHQPYGGYGMQPSYLSSGVGSEEHEYNRPFDAYASSARGYASYADPYARPSGYGGYAPDGPASSGYLGARPEASAPHQYGRTPPPPPVGHMVHPGSYAPFERNPAASHAYPSHPPPPPPAPHQHQHPHQQQQQRSNPTATQQWPY